MKLKSAEGWKDPVRRVMREKKKKRTTKPLFWLYEKLLWFMMNDKCRGKFYFLNVVSYTNKL